MSSPYSGLPARQFWRTGVREVNWSDGGDLYRRKFEITNTARIMTAGSCFAQNVASHLKRRGFWVLDGEPAPSGMSEATARRFGYSIYSARYGNVYTARQLKQLLLEALGRSDPSNAVWEKAGRYYDALRPSVEPNGLDSPEEVQAHRRDHLFRLRHVIEQTDLLVFTFGLTEAWIHEEDGTVYPTAPGTVAGHFNPDIHAFSNFSYEETLADFERVRRLLKRIRPQIKFILTVSPVPLTATAEDSHVLPATIYSKSILRAVAGSLARRFSDVDYFPAYEIVGTPFVGSYYDESKRKVTDEGIARVMDVFFREHGEVTPRPRKSGRGPASRRLHADAANLAAASRDEEICEEILLDAFAP